MLALLFAGYSIMFKDKLEIYMTTIQEEKRYIFLKNTLSSLIKSCNGKNLNEEYNIYIFFSKLKNGSEEEIINNLIPNAICLYPKCNLNMFQNSIRAIVHGSLRQKWFLFLQDDIIVGRNFIYSVKKSIVDSPTDAGCVTFFTPHDHRLLAKYSKKGGRYLLYPPDFYWGCQSILLRTTFLREYLNSNVFKNHKEIFKNNPCKHLDLSIGLFVKHESKYNIYSHVPCLVQHTGSHDSTIGNEGIRLSPNFDDQFSI